MCGVRTARLQNHMKQEHLPFFLFPDTACWVCGIQMARPSTLRRHLLDSHQTLDKCGFQHHLAAVWALTVNGFLFSLAGLFQLVSPEALRALAVCLGLLPREVPEKDRATRELYAASCPSSPGAASPATISDLLDAHALGGLCAQLPGSCKIRLPGLLTVPCGFSGLPSSETARQFAVDSHFHLDRLLKASSTSTFQEALDATPGKPPYTLRYAIAVYCDPSNWQKDDCFAAEDRRVFRSIGFHPSRVNTAAHLPDLQDRMKLLLADARAVALGEVGLDYHPKSSSRTRSRQRSLLSSMLRLAVELKKPVVIHCRGYGSADAEVDCLRLCTQILPRFHPIHRHCFTGSRDELRAWLAIFPNTVFGFTSLLTPEIYSAISLSLPLSHTVLESDAPHLVPDGAGTSFSSPFLLSHVADTIASVRGCSVNEILSVTGATAVRFYGLEPSYFL